MQRSVQTQAQYTWPVANFSLLLTISKILTSSVLRYLQNRSFPFNSAKWALYMHKCGLPTLLSKETRDCPGGIVTLLGCENVLEKIEPLVSTGVSLAAMVTGVIFSDTLDKRLSLASFSLSHDGTWEDTL